MITSIKKSFKYFLIVFINMLVLDYLFVKSTDELDYSFGFFLMYELELLKIIGLTIVALALIYVMVRIMNRMSITNLKIQKIISAILLTLFVSSYLYIDYTVKLYSRSNDNTRASLNRKIKPDSEIYGAGSTTIAEALTLEEYWLLVKIAGFPKVPDMAENISFSYWREDILPDHLFRLTYEIPVTVEIEEFEINERQFSEIQKVQILEGKKIVTYQSNSW
jgi:hypothetical protein